MKGFVINLDRREDRYNLFKNIFENIDVDITRVSAIDNQEIVWTDELKKRVCEWNFINIPNKVKNVVACCLSHMKVWELIQMLDEPAFVFEDDVAFINNEYKNKFNEFIKVKIKGDLVYFNRNIQDTIGMKFNTDNFTLEKALDQMFTAESYLLSPKLAGEMLVWMHDYLGAVDAHIFQYVKSKHVECYMAHPPFFCQRDRTDTDIQVTNTIKSFVINLKRRPDRLEQFYKRAGKKIEVVYGFDGKLPLTEAVESEIKLYHKLKEMGKHRTITIDGECGCLISHYKIFKKMINESIPIAMIFEDDAQFSEDFWKRISNISTDTILYFGGRFTKDFMMPSCLCIPHGNVVKHVYTPFVPVYHDRTLHGYIITQTIAKKLISEIEDMKYFEPIDHIMIKFFVNENIPVYSTLPLLCWSPMVGDSDIR